VSRATLDRRGIDLNFPFSRGTRFHKLWQRLRKFEQSAVADGDSDSRRQRVCDCRLPTVEQFAVAGCDWPLL